MQTPRTRDAERTRSTILDAAEMLFAARGFEGASLQEIAEVAGVSRGTPSYFFGSKDGLYQAVLERLFLAEQAFVSRTQTDVLSSGAGLDDVLAALVERFIDFLVERPAFVRIVGWEALNGGARLRTSIPHEETMLGGLAFTRELLSSELFRDLDPLDVLVSTIALCWFPLSQADGLLAPFALKPLDPDVIARHKRHVVDLLLRGIVAVNDSDEGG